MKEESEAEFCRLEKRIMAFYEDNPYVKHLDIKLVTLGKSKVKLMMKAAATHINTYGAAHGGALMSLADTAMGAACLMREKKVVTLEMNINCMKSVPADCTIYAVAEIIHDGAHTMVAECKIIDKNEKLYAKSRGSFYVIDKFTE